MYICLCSSICVYVYVRVWVCVCMSMYMNLCVCVSIYMNLCVCVYVYVCMTCVIGINASNISGFKDARTYDLYIVLIIYLYKYYVCSHCHARNSIFVAIMYTKKPTTWLSCMIATCQSCIKATCRSCTTLSPLYKEDILYC